MFLQYLLEIIQNKFLLYLRKYNHHRTTHRLTQSIRVFWTKGVKLPSWMEARKPCNACLRKRQPNVRADTTPRTPFLAFHTSLDSCLWLEIPIQRRLSSWACPKYNPSPEASTRILLPLWLFLVLSGNDSTIFETGLYRIKLILLCPLTTTTKYIMVTRLLVLAIRSHPHHTKLPLEVIKPDSPMTESASALT